MENENEADCSSGQSYLSFILINPIITPNYLNITYCTEYFLNHYTHFLLLQPSWSAHLIHV